jgi:hypothetical protein
MPDIVRVLQRNVYHASVGELTSLRAGLTDVELLLLLTFSNMRYEDPLKAINANAIADWMVESDYVLDRTAIHAALRSLEYRELMTHRSGSLELTIGMLQTWLLESTTRAGIAISTPRLSRRVLAAVLVIALLALVLVVVLSNTPQSESVPTSAPRPTVTLANGESTEEP